MRDDRLYLSNIKKCIERNDRDNVSIQVWNTESRIGPAVCSRIVNDTSERSCLTEEDHRYHKNPKNW